MKYLKHINEYNSNEYFQEISKDDYYNAGRIRTEYPSKESLVCDITQIEYDKMSDVTIDPGWNRPIFLWEKRGHQAIFRIPEKDLSVIINKFVDEWFYIRVLNESFTKFYKCDQIEGVIELLTELIENGRIGNVIIYDQD